MTLPIRTRTYTSGTTTSPVFECPTDECDTSIALTEGYEGAGLPTLTCMTCGRELRFRGVGAPTN